MSSASQFLTQDHRGCDTQWIEVEAVADKGDVAATRAAFAKFEHTMKHHFEFEEHELFPALEAATSMNGFGPTVVMRNEHEQMRRVLGAMSNALERGDTRALLDQGDTLLMLVQQHNLKEERILYPLADARLADAWPTLQAKF